MSVTIHLPLNVRAERLYERYTNLAYSIAKKMADKYNRPYQELADEALSCLAGMATEATFDVTKASACTWIYQNIYWSLRCYCDALHRRRDLPLNEGIDEDRKKPNRLQRIMAEVGEEGSALLKIILDAPGDLARDLSPRAPTRSKNALLKHLRHVEGWEETRILRAWSQVDLCLVG